MHTSAPLRPLVLAGKQQERSAQLPSLCCRYVRLRAFLAQCGRKHPHAKPLKGFGSAGVLEIVEDDRGDTFRAVYTVRFTKAVFVLHVFHKKSRKRITTSASDIEQIHGRLKIAEAIAKGLDENANDIKDNCRGARQRERLSDLGYKKMLKQCW
jgi:phage-related protein